MADDLATYSPEVVTPLDVPSPADIDQQTADQLGQMSQQSKQMFETMTTGPLTSKLENEALQQGNAFEAPTAFTQGQALANQQALHLNALAMQSDASIQSNKYMNEAVAQDGFTPQTLQDYQHNMQGYAQGQMDTASASMRPFVQESLIRQGALTTNVIGKKVQQYNVAQNLNSYENAQRQGSADTAAIGTNEFSVDESDEPENTTLPQANLQAGLTGRLQLTNLALQGTLIGKQQAVKDHHSAYVDYYQSLWSGPYRQALANDQAADLQTSSQGLPSASTQAQDYINKLSDKNTKAGSPHIGPLDVNNIVSHLKGIETTSKAQGQESVTGNDNDINSLKLQALHTGKVDPALYGKVASNNGLSIGDISTHVGENIQSNNVATELSALPVATQATRLNSLKNGTDVSSAELQKLGFSSDSVSQIDKGVIGLVGHNLSLAFGKNADTGQYIDNNLAWQKVLGDSVIKNANLQSGNDQNIVKNASSIIPQFNLEKDGTINLGLTPGQSNGLQAISVQKSNYMTNTLGIPSESASLYSKSQNLQLATNLEKQPASIQDQILQKYQSLYGGAYPSFMHGLLKSGFNPIGMLSSGVTDVATKQAFDIASSTNFKTLQKQVFGSDETGKADFNTLQANVNDDLSDWTSRALMWPDANRQSQQENVNQTSQSVLSVAMALHEQGLSITDAAQQASDAAINNKYSYAGNTAIPSSITVQVPDPQNPGKTKPMNFNMPSTAYTEDALETLKNTSIATLANNMRKTSTSITGKPVSQAVANQMAVAVENRGANASYINSPDNTRAVLVDQFRQPFNVAIKGIQRPLSVNWSDIFNLQATTGPALAVRQAAAELQQLRLEAGTGPVPILPIAGAFEK